MILVTGDTVVNKDATVSKDDVPVVNCETAMSTGELELTTVDNLVESSVTVTKSDERVYNDSLTVTTKRYEMSTTEPQLFSRAIIADQEQIIKLGSLDVLKCCVLKDVFKIQTIEEIDDMAYGKKNRAW